MKLDCREVILCLCGCGEFKLKYRSKNKLATPYINGHRPRRKQKTNKELYPNNIKYCGGCKTELKLSDFGITKDKNQRHYIRTRCKICNVKAQKDYAIRLGNKYRKIRKKNKEKSKKRDPVHYFITERIASYRKNGSDLTTKYLKNLWYAQRGLCYLTGEEMIPNAGEGTNSPAKNSMSLDKINPNLGYIIGNVAWCTYHANTSKGRRTLDEFYDFCRGVLERHGKLS